MRSYQETLNYIFNLRGGAIDLRLNRVAQALSLFGHPERCYPAFHIAGTNGKGSTAAMLHRILSVQGYRVALYTSPHLVSFTERIRVGDQEISEEEVVELADTIRDRVVEPGVPLTFFEFVTVMALVYFARCEVDVAVVEVGLGGRLDATNLIVPKVSIITNVSMDHEAFLGTDLLSIAQEKGGIIKKGVPVICGPLSRETSTVIENIAYGKEIEPYFFNRDFSIDLKEDGHFDYSGQEWDLSDLCLGLRGKYQKKNAAVALAALEVMRGDFPVREAVVRESLKTVFWPGRFEVISHCPRVILDGAHNVQGVKALAEEVREFVGGERVKLLFGAMDDKDWSEMLCCLSNVSTEVMLTRVPMDRSADPKDLSRSLPGGTPVTVIEDPVEAVASLISSSAGEQTILITGSLYLIGHVRPWLLKTELLESWQGRSRNLSLGA